MNFAAHLKRKLVQCGWAMASLGVYHKCPVCLGDGYDPSTEATSFLGDLKRRERCPLCLGANAVPALEMDAVQRGTHSRQTHINFLLALLQHRRNTLQQGIKAAQQSVLTLADVEREAVRRFPSLGVHGSAFNAEFFRLQSTHEREHPEIFNDILWPLRVAYETNEALKAQIKNG